VRKLFVRPKLPEISLERVLGLAYLFFGGLLLLYSYPHKEFSDDLLITDLMWLDAWSLAFFFALFAYWNGSSSISNKCMVSLLYLSLFLVVANNLILDGTSYYLYGYSGDQKFRQAMVLKFMTFFSLGDFYYKDLPAFYPPLYYYLQAMFAKIFSIEAYKMAKIGQIFIFAMFPMILYYFWRKIVSPFQAMIITFLSFLYCNYSNATQFFSPHTFLAYALFIPWWFVYVDPVKDQQKTVRLFIIGGLIGALIFLTYFYVFAIGFFYILLKLISDKWLMSKSQIKWPDIKNTVVVLGLAAIFSAVYWLPMLISIMESGAHRSPSGWYHIGYPGLSFQFLQFSIIGMVLLAGIIYLLRRLNNRLKRGLGLFVASVIVFHLIGSVTGAMGVSLKITKSTNIFFVQLAAPIIGLMLAAICRRDRVGRKKSIFSIVATCVLLLILLNNISGIAKSEGAKRARKAIVPTWGTDGEEMETRQGDVFLLGDPAFPAFYPVYSFLNVNEHYAHPSSKYFNRYEFLYYLQSIKNPYLLNVALRHNVYDKVNFFMPSLDKSKFSITASFSNYPNRSYNKILKYEQEMFTDTNYFEKLKGQRLYAVKENDSRKESVVSKSSYSNVLDSLKMLVGIRALSRHLSETGRRLFEEELNIDWSLWNDFSLPDNGHDYGGEITMLSGHIIEQDDSLYVLISYLSKTESAKFYKISLHLFDSSKSMHNFDFTPTPNTNKWKKWDLFVCGRSIPNEQNYEKFSTGFYIGKEKVGREFISNWKVAHE